MEVAALFSLPQATIEQISGILPLLAVPPLVYIISAGLSVRLGQVWDQLCFTFTDARAGSELQ